MLSANFLIFSDDGDCSSRESISVVMEFINNFIEDVRVSENSRGLV